MCGKEVAFSKYYQELDAKDKNRYKEKITECGQIDPYSNVVKFEDDVFLWPPVTYPDIVNYLVFTTSFATGRQMKAYKSMAGYNFFVSGWVRNIGVKRIQKEGKERRLLYARVNHSQRANESPLKTWLLIETDGEVVTAHCNCMAGLCEVCSHVGAVLFALEAGTRIRDTQTCTEKSCQWVLPTSLKQVPYVEIQNIDFASAKRKKRELDNNLTSPTALRRLNSQSQEQAVTPTEEEKLHFFKAISETGSRSSVLSIIPTFCDAFVPKQQLPIDLTTLFDVEALELQFHELLTRCAEMEEDIIVTDEMAHNVEKLTRDQSSSKEWFTYRSGRITASRMKSACHTDPAKPSLSLINSICYPNKFRFTNEATKWGCDHEKTAQTFYFNIQKSKHQEFNGKDGGLHLNPDYPYIGASPDGVVECKCCGKGVCEIKCPLCFKDETIEDTAASKKSCIQRTEDGIKLDRKHAYYYQVQTQILICQAKYCDFIVFTTKEISIERIYPDKDFIKSMVEKARHFFRVGILPQLVANWYSSQVLTAPMRNDEAGLFCYCKKKDDGRLKVACGNEDCAWQWFHLDCLGLKGVPKSRNWLCPTCRKMPHLKKSKRSAPVMRN